VRRSLAKRGIPDSSEEHITTRIGLKALVEIDKNRTREQDRRPSPEILEPILEPEKADGNFFQRSLHPSFGRVGKSYRSFALLDSYTDLCQRFPRVDTRYEFSNRPLEG
jgi:hypothetical protein